MKTKLNKMMNLFRWAIIALFLVSILVFAKTPLYGTAVIALTGCIFICLHGPKQYGWKMTGLFILIAFTVSTVLEDLSIHTGFPFGHYHYNLNSLGMPFPVPQLDLVPIAVGPMYIAIGYFSWSIGCLILNHADRDLNRNKLNIAALPVISAFIMCQFDLVQDPATSTFQGMWIWEDGGGIFGVPLSNFIGWYFTCYLFMQIFTLVLAHQQKKRKAAIFTPELQRKEFWLQPVLLYLLIAFSYVVQYIGQAHNRISLTDPAGNEWFLSELYETAVGIMLFTMLFSSLLAVYHLFADDRCKVS